jgi:thiol-disulfide isomerase/thioredoxin
VDLAIQTAQQMLRTLPYDAEVAFAIRFMKEYLEQSGNAEAVNLAGQEHRALVQALAAGVPLKAAFGDAVMATGSLYQSAMQMAFLQHYTGDDAGASATVSDIETAVGSGVALNPEDERLIAAVRAQYRLLGQHLPDVKPLRSLQSPAAGSKTAAKTETRLDSNYGAATVLVLFPDWCAQCRRMMKTLTQFAQVNKDTPIHAYGLMFQEDSDSGLQTSHEDVTRELQGTATLLVSPETAQTFAAVDYPLGIVVDARGTIRFIGALPSDAFNGKGYISKVIERMTAKDGAAPPAATSGESRF